jgi:hypothetical protein
MVHQMAHLTARQTMRRFVGITCRGTLIAGILGCLGSGDLQAAKPDKPVADTTASEAKAGAKAEAKASRELAKLKGGIVFQRESFGEFDSDEALVKAVQEAKKVHAISAGSSGHWELSLLALLRRAPGGRKINVVWYRRQGGKPEVVDFTEYVVSPTQTMFKASIQLAEGQGFKRGDDLEARVTQVENGKEVVFAKGTIALH